LITSRQVAPVLRIFGLLGRTARCRRTDRADARTARQHGDAAGASWICCRIGWTLLFYRAWAQAQPT
jgi:hypothetical protein